MKKILTVLLLLALALTSCDDGNGTTHTHTYAAAWSTDAAQHWHECTANDGAKTDIAPHTAGDWIIAPQATYDTDGSQHKECTVCEYITETETIAKFKTEQPFTIGSVNFIFEYRRDDTTSQTKLETWLQTYGQYASDNPETEPADMWVLLVGHNKPIKVIIDYSNEGKGVGFKALDTQTLRVGADYLSEINTTRAILTTSFGVMLNGPWETA